VDADDMTVAVYKATREFPREEIYGLTSQLRRAAYSVAANIAEGSARGTNKDYLHFLYIARSSLAETQYFVHLSKRLEYLSAETAQSLEAQIKSAFVRLHGVIKAVEQETGRTGRVLAALSSGLGICIGRVVLRTSGLA
jgi:four helix bundle protein